jgi:hypothetical protein
MAMAEMCADHLNAVAVKDLKGSCAVVGERHNSYSAAQLYGKQKGRTNSNFNLAVHVV